ncbi:nitroreductase family protein [Nocardia vaccinii]|uniref:nitroreductase family protein n=1 Tax=Nocardia vaccinii TaxID=1822 RepID=UPI000A0559DA|nr:nitroreductase family protein [Nocardia vaccinii]
MSTASAVRRYRPEPVADSVLETCLRAASWAPSGGNQQQWRFVVIRSAAVRAVITEGARRTWDKMSAFYDLERPADTATDAKSRVLRAMWEHMNHGGDAPVCVVCCTQPQRGVSDFQQGGSLYPAVQNFLLAARAQGLGAAITLWQDQCEDELRASIGIPADWRVAALITAGWPKGRHHEVRRKPFEEMVAIDCWERAWSMSGNHR